MSLKPTARVPALDLPLVGGGRFDLAAQQPQTFTMLVFYRGLHCPICKGYIGDLDRKLEKFRERGVAVAAISTDTQERAAQTKRDWGIEQVPLAHDFTIDEARDWGLTSRARSRRKSRRSSPSPGCS